nr:putative retrotransposon protein [Tanacetum cinerariifolium]
HYHAVVNDDDDDKIIAYFEKRKKLTLESEDYQQTLQFMYNLRVKEGRTCGFCELPVPSLQLFWVHKDRCGVCSKLGQSILTESREAPLDTELEVTGFCDASWQCYKDDTKCQRGFVFVINGGAVDWKSKKQTTIAMHATQSE